MKEIIDIKSKEIGEMREIIGQMQENEERLQVEITEKEDEINFCRAQFRQTQDLKDQLELKIVDLQKNNSDLHNEILTLQRINETLKEDSSRTSKKHDHVSSTVAQLTAELEKTRKQLFDQLSLTQTQKFDLDQL